MGGCKYRQDYGCAGLPVAGFVVGPSGNSFPFSGCVLRDGNGPGARAELCISSTGFLRRVVFWAAAPADHVEYAGEEPSDGYSDRCVRDRNHTCPGVGHEGCCTKF
jgi:hypothetical protein